MGFNLKHTLLLGWPVLSVLLVFSVISVAIYLQCFALLRKARRLAQGKDQGENTLLHAIFDTVEQRLAVLGTVANAAPFVGLLGTVIGIIRAFHSISMSAGGGGITVVAGGISEALVSTAAGLFVAIPASMAYNYYTFKAQRLAEDAGIE